MTVLDPPRHPQVTAALRLSAALCAGQVIDDAPALRHAVAVARTLATHVPDMTPAMAAAALLHDAPLFAPADWPADKVAARLDQVTAGTSTLVFALVEQHRLMDAGAGPTPDDGPVTLIAAADKIVAFTSLRRRAARSDDETAFWTRRAALRALLPYFATWTTRAQPHLPPAMHAALADAYTQLADTIARHVCGPQTLHA